MVERLNTLAGRIAGLGVRRVAALGGAAVAVVGLLLIASWGGGSAWVPVAAGIPLEQMGEVTRSLEEAKIEHRLAAGGARVEVPEQELARARVELASRGLPGPTGKGFELFDQPAWGMTDFTQRINYRRALEGELERTIGAMEGVKSARVHLALQQSSVLRGARRPAEASVVVQMASGARPTAGLVEGVGFLVASSVDELSSDHVTVLDHSGRLMTRSVEDEEGFGLTHRQLELRSEVEEYLEAKAEALVSDVLGAGNARVRVAAELNLDRVDRTVQAVNPDQQMMTREERTEITPGPEDVGAASVAYKTDFAATRSVERYTSGYGDVKRLSVALLLNEDAESAAGERVDADPARLQALVAAAIGLNPGRGDVISVVKVPFDRPAALPEGSPGPSFWELWDTLQRPVLTVIGLLLAFVLGMKMIRSLAVAPRAQSRALAPGSAESAGGLSAAAPGAAPPLDKGEALRQRLNEVQAQRMQAVTSGVMERPDLAARVVQAWLKD